MARIGQAEIMQKEYHYHWNTKSMQKSAQKQKVKIILLWLANRLLQRIEQKDSRAVKMSCSVFFILAFFYLLGHIILI